MKMQIQSRLPVKHLTPLASLSLGALAVLACQQVSVQNQPGWGTGSEGLEPIAFVGEPLADQAPDPMAPAQSNASQSPPEPADPVPQEKEAGPKTKQATPEPAADGAQSKAGEPAQDPGASPRGDDPSTWEEITELDGKPVETIRSYHPGGNLRRIHTQLIGVVGPPGHHGRDLLLYPNGVVQQESFWRNGQLEGPYQEWFEGALLRVEAQFTGGLRSGTFKEYGEGGNLRTEGQYLNGRLHGELKLTYGNGRPEEQSSWERGVQVGDHRKWNPGSIPLFHDRYEDGVRHGLSRNFFRVASELGEEKVQEAGEYIRGQKHGAWEEWDEEGNLRVQRYFENNTLTGPYSEWKAGILVLDTEYKGGLEEGERREFYAGGARFSEGEMKKGAREGHWTYWTEAGEIQPQWSGIYEGGTKVAEPDGTPVPKKPAPKKTESPEDEGSETDDSAEDQARSQKPSHTGAAKGERSKEPTQTAVVRLQEVSDV